MPGPRAPRSGRRTDADRSAGEPGSGRVLGVDAAGKYGWVGVVVDDEGFVGARTGSLPELIGWAEPVAVIGVDIPIGDVAGGVRRADVEARRFVGPRGASVFAAPPAEALGAPSCAEANATLRTLGVPMLSRQAWALVPKMAETAAVAALDPRVVEVHPEVSFRALAGEPLRWSKKSWNGLLLRRRLLAEADICCPTSSPRCRVPWPTTWSTPPWWPGPPVGSLPGRRAPCPTRRRTRMVAPWRSGTRTPRARLRLRR